jgi:ornithine cyclodeaminase/alanine dehydrogenase-like protein (mu-crystallin family)
MDTGDILNIGLPYLIAEGSTISAERTAAGAALAARTRAAR